MEILKFDELKKVQAIKNAPDQKIVGVSSNVKSNQNLKRKLIADVLCSSIKGTDKGCCKQT
jgi:hypothetical protein